MAPIFELLDLPSTISLLCLGTFSYGLHAAVAGSTIYFTLREIRKRKQISTWHFAFTFALFTFGTFNCIASVADYFYQFQWREIPKFAFVSDIAALIVTVLCNGFLLFRCYLMWNRAWYVVIFPLLLLLATVVIGGLHVDRVRHNPQIGNTKEWLPPLLLVYWALSIALNAILTGLLAWRVLSMRRVLRKLMGESISGVYGGGLSVFVESSLLYTVVATAGLPLIHIGSGYMFSPLHVQFECIASELIILRVIMGRAITQTSDIITTDSTEMEQRRNSAATETHV